MMDGISYPKWLALVVLIVGMVLAPEGQAGPGKHKGPALKGERSSTMLRDLPAPPRAKESRLPKSKLQKARSDNVRKLKLGQDQSLLRPAAGSSLALAAATSRLYFGAPGSPADRSTLVLYDDGGSWGWLGEAYALQSAQLASHGGAYTFHPVRTYTAGEMTGYSAVVYVGSTYDEPIPVAFLDDVLAGGRPVLWMNFNIWQLVARAPDFAARFGFQPQFIDFSSQVAVAYKGAELTRSPEAWNNGLLQISVTDPLLATVLAQAKRDDGVYSPWAVRGGNLTYIGEIPFSYVGPDDRYLAAADLIAQQANPNGPDRKRALVRIEDVGPDADPAELRAIADLLYARRIPFSVAVYPVYKDPNGAYNGGVPVTVKMSRAPAVVSALRYMQARGGTLIMHGYTHQYEARLNPYTGTSADDFEFYLSHVDADDYVRYDGAVPLDSARWTDQRLANGLNEFTAAGLGKPTIFEFPHYAGSALDYQRVRLKFTTRYDRGLYAANWCPGGNCGTGTPDYTRIHGQYFPFLVRDIFDTIVIPESLGNIELEAANHHPPRYPADILATAQRNAVVKDGVLSFFFHPYVPVSYLGQVVDGIRGQGYQFVSANQVRAP